MSGAWPAPVWGEPSPASRAPVPLRNRSLSSDAVVRADGGSCAWASILAATVAGVAHRLKGRPGEDVFAWELGAPDARGEPQCIAIAVADGLSSAARGAEGALVAAGEAVRKAAEHGGPQEQACLAGLRAAEAAVVSLSAQVPVQDLATTLVVAVVSPGEGGTGLQVACGRVGDSSAFVLDGEGRWEELPFRALDGAVGGQGDEDMVETRTRALGVTEGGGGKEIAGPLSLGPDASVLLLSDGVWRPLLDGPSTVAPALAGLVGAARQAALGPIGWAEAIGFGRRGANDDRTAVVVWPRLGS